MKNNKLKDNSPIELIKSDEKKYKKIKKINYNTELFYNKKLDLNPDGDSINEEENEKILDKNKSPEKPKRKNKFLLEIKNKKIYDFENFEYSKSGDKLNIIGKGAYSEVLLARNLTNQKNYAIKKINKNLIKNKDQKFSSIPQEILIHRKIIHENILKAYSHYEDKNSFYLITEYINNGNLYQKVLKTNGLSEDTAYKYFKQVIKAVEFLHENNLIHRDIKPENILLTKNDKVKLCDFGCCVDIKQGYRETFCGTFEYMAPEIIKELPYNQAVDIWSLGILLYELLHGFSPFSNRTDNQRDLSEIFKNILINNLNFKNNISQSCKDLIKSKDFKINFFRIIDR